MWPLELGRHLTRTPSFLNNGIWRKLIEMDEQENMQHYMNLLQKKIIMNLLTIHPDSLIMESAMNIQSSITHHHSTKERAMKTVLSFFTALMLVSASGAFAQGSPSSRVDGTITNKAQVESSKNTAIGSSKTSADANQGSVQISDSKVERSGSVNNEASIKGSHNTATAGRGSADANMGSVQVEDSTVGGRISNNAKKIDRSTNFADGTKGTANANMGSVQLEDSTVEKGGTVTNEATIKNSTNTAIGSYRNRADANMGSVQLKDSIVSGDIHNKANIDKSHNTSMPGYGTADANMGSVQVQDSEVKGHISNDGTVKDSTNLSDGTRGTADANVGSVQVD